MMRALVPGINYPWTRFDGRANYGCDFGRNRWGSHTGVSVNTVAVRDDFTAIAAAGVDVVRWFVFTDGRAGLEWNASDGTLMGIERVFFDDMNAALDIASDAGVRLCLVLLDFPWFDDPHRRLQLLDRDGRSAFVERVLDPFLDRYGRAAAIHSIDLINEPDWVIAELATDPRRAAWPLERLRRFCSLMSQRIRSRSAIELTLGGGRVSRVREWDHAAYDLDFIQVHTYPDVRFPGRDGALLGTPASALGVGRPVLIGEFPAHPRLHPPAHLSPAYSIADYLQLAREGGYLGAWPWSFQGTDAFGRVDLAAFRGA
jgi:hypothetical protein